MTNQKELTLNQVQSLVDTWIKTVGNGYFSELTNTVILMEEVGEMSRLMARIYGGQTFKNSDKDKNLADEMADVLWVLTCLANQTGINLQDAFEKNMLKKTERDSNRFQ